VKCKFIILIIAIFQVASTFAIENRPKMRRVCLSQLDSIVDLLWFRPTDNCNSFTSFSVYGRDGSLNLFEYIGSYSSYSLDNVSFKIKNRKKSWEFYLVYNKACNGIDSVYSDTMFVDQTEPFNSQLDSISVDLATQKTILGWAKNPSPDIKGYFVYHVTGTNAVIATTTSTFHLDNGARNPGTGKINYSIAAFDSCNNISLISSAHTTIFLQSAYDQCNKKITLNWSRYSGWPGAVPEQNYEIFLKVNGGNFQLIGTVVPAITQFTYNFPVFGDDYTFYVRAFKAGNPNISSSSNTVTITTNSVKASKNSYIAKASVQNKQIELTLVTELGTSLQKLNIYKAEDTGPFSLWQTLNNTGGIVELQDNNVSVHSKSYRYYFNTEGPCALIFDSSQIAKTILLNVLMTAPGNQQINWSLYNDFIKSTQNQELLLSNDEAFNKSSPWNILTTFNNSTKFAVDKTVFSVNQQKICYAIRAIENPPNPTFQRQDTSYSNIECVTADPIVFFPNAIQLNGYNTVFYPKGTFIDTTKSSFVVYNRWGQIIYETNNINTGWDGKENGEYIQSDVYAYRATIVGINGKTVYFDGTITVLK
jgi:gliding motility-associated-like protein